MTIKVDHVIEDKRIAALKQAVNVEERWVGFMKEQGYPKDGQKMKEGTTRLSNRVRSLDEALAKTQPSLL